MSEKFYVVFFYDAYLICHNMVVLRNHSEEIYTIILTPFNKTKLPQVGTQESFATLNACACISWVVSGSGRVSSHAVCRRGVLSRGRLLTTFSHQ